MRNRNPPTEAAVRRVTDTTRYRCNKCKQPIADDEYLVCDGGDLVRHADPCPPVPDVLTADERAEVEELSEDAARQVPGYPRLLRLLAILQRVAPKGE